MLNSDVLSKLASGRTNGRISSSAHRREQREGYFAATCSGIANPRNFSMCLSPNSLSLHNTKSTILDELDEESSGENLSAMKSSRYVVSRMAIATVEVELSEVRHEMPA